MYWLPFVSKNGKLAGVAQRVEGRFVGVVLAALEKECCVSDWCEALSSTEGPSDAVEKLVATHGGFPVFKVVSISNTSSTQVVFPSVGEA